MKRKNGLSVIEVFVVMVLLLIILSGVFLMIIHYGDVSKTELSRLRLHQESRFMLSSFASELKSAGAVLTLANTGSFLSKIPHFNGIYPLNNDSFADGIIIATGDPNCVSTLTQTYKSSKGNEDTINVENTCDKYGNQLWAAGDKGIIIGPSVDPDDANKTIGYYVFSVSKVTAPTATTITLRANPVYYSGLLATTNYIDVQTENGNDVTYPIKSPVIKITNFSIYLIKRTYDSTLKRDSGQLVRVIDANNDSDVLADDTTAVTSVISENIWDMQISYTSYSDFPATTPKTGYFAGGTSSTSLPDLLLDIRQKLLKELKVSFVVLTDEYGGAGKQTLKVPAFEDLLSSYDLPTGKFGYKILSFVIEPRNYNIVI